MASRFSQSPVAAAALSNHLDRCSIAADDVDSVGRDNRDRDSETASSSYGNGVSTTTTATSMVYFPQTIVLCDLRHEAFEVRVPTGPADSGLVSKWRPKDRVSSFLPHHFIISSVFMVVSCLRFRAFVEAPCVLYRWNFC